MIESDPWAGEVMGIRRRPITEPFPEGKKGDLLYLEADLPSEGRLYEMQPTGSWKQVVAVRSYRECVEQAARVRADRPLAPTD